MPHGKILNNFQYLSHTNSTATGRPHADNIVVTIGKTQRLTFNSAITFQVFIINNPPVSGHGTGDFQGGKSAIKFVSTLFCYARQCFRQIGKFDQFPHCRYFFGGEKHCPGRRILVHLIIMTFEAGINVISDRKTLFSQINGRLDQFVPGQKSVFFPG